MKVGFSGANFAIADTGGICVVESEGNGRMCVTLPRVLITLVGIEKIVPSLADLEVFLQLLPRSATGERMNPYNSIWTGTRGADGPEEFHVVLLDNGRTRCSTDPESRETLHCIRCAACLNACPVYRQTGGHAYGSIYSGPIGAILTPQLQAMEHSTSLPYASSLCGACYEVCPVKINIPEILIHLRRRIVEEDRPRAEGLAMRAAALAFSGGGWLALAQRLGRLAQRPFADGRLDPVAARAGAGGPRRAICRRCRHRSFREWWASRKDGRGPAMIERSGARADILDAIRRADSPRPASARDEDYAGDRQRDYAADGTLDRDASASRCSPIGSSTTTSACTTRRRSRCRAAIAEVCAARGKRQLVVPDGFPAAVAAARSRVRARRGALVRRARSVRRRADAGDDCRSP